MSNFAEKIAEYNKTLKFYNVVPTTDVLGEDGNYLSKENAGYAIENTETGVVEHTTICLPAALYQATHFDDMLESLLSPKAKPSMSLVDMAVPEDVVPS